MPEDVQAGSERPDYAAEHVPYWENSALDSRIYLGEATAPQDQEGQSPEAAGRDECEPGAHPATATPHPSPGSTAHRSPAAG